jgi:monoamine oxidase
MARPIDAIVIGAGAAGLAAARALGEAGHATVIVEARDRIGGRVWTQSIEGFPLPVEIGRRRHRERTGRREGGRANVHQHAFACTSM